MLPYYHPISLSGADLPRKPRIGRLLLYSLLSTACALLLRTGVTWAGTAQSAQAVGLAPLITPSPSVTPGCGLAWRIVTSPNTGARTNEVGWIGAINSNDIWAVGDYRGEDYNRQVLAEHWDGSQWSIVPGADIGTNISALGGVGAISRTDVWVAGRFDFNGVGRTLIEHYSDPCITTPTVVPTVAATATATATGTATALLPTSTQEATATSVATPTACTITFMDVPPDNTFYPAIRCLACGGIISGYNDGTFRPNVQVTRGQLAKIVSNSASFNDAVTGQSFEDVPPSNTFYVWIERLTTRGYMSGYQCGGLGEPCTTGKPYFRPFANATRGQTAKIVSNARGLTEEVTGQTFQDVPSTNAFYPFIQRLANRGVMGGYPCGGAGEQCVAPDNRPYFRPNNDVTRGQSAKIVANTFFPGCEVP